HRGRRVPARAADGDRGRAHRSTAPGLPSLGGAALPLAAGTAAPSGARPRLSSVLSAPRTTQEATWMPESFSISPIAYARPARVWPAVITATALLAQVAR